MPSGPAIPNEKLNQLKAQLLAPSDDKLSYSVKVRRLQAVLRDGEQMESDHPDAANGHLIRGILLDAARQLAIAEGDTESQGRVFEIAKKIVALPGPPEGKIWADFILTQGRAAQLTDNPEALVAMISEFVGRFTDTSVEPIALMAALDMASKSGDPRFNKTLTTALLKYREEPVVEAFLSAHSANVFRGYSLNTTLTTMDGTTLRLPRDAMGKITVLYFWTIASTDIPFMRLFYDRHHDLGVEIIGINLDTNREQVEAFIRQQGLAWPQVFSGQGMNDPLFKRLGIPWVPYYWVLRQDATAVMTNPTSGYEGQNVGGSGNFSLKQMTDVVDADLDAMTDFSERLPYYRSGEFLAFSKLLQSTGEESKNPISKADIDALRAKALVPPAPGLTQTQKIQSLKEAASIGKSLEKAHPGAGNLSVVRALTLVATKWLALATGANDYNEDALALAKRMLASHADGAFLYLADYVATSSQLAASKADKRARAAQIQDYVNRYSAMDVAWGAQMLGVMLALEDGQDSIREQLTGKLIVSHSHRPGMIACAFLRDVCKVKLPDDIPEAQILEGNGRSPLDEAAPGGAQQALGDKLRSLTEAGRLPFYRSGEFMVLARLLRPDITGNPKDAVPPEEFDAFSQNIEILRQGAATQEEKTAAFKEILAAGAALEANYPLAAQVQLIRGAMLIAARWLTLTSGDKAQDELAASIANRILSANPKDASGLLADYTLTSRQLSKLKPDAKTAAGMIQEFALRHEKEADQWAVGLLAILLCDDGQESLRAQWVSKLRGLLANRPDSIVYGFLRDFCEESYAFGRDVHPFKFQLTRMDGQPLTLPDDLPGKVVILQFWSAAHPPEPFRAKSFSRRTLPYTGLASVPSNGVVIVGVNLDRNRAAAEAFLKQNNYPDWVHTFSGLGWDDKAARLLDVYSLPKTIILNRRGEVYVSKQSNVMNRHEAISGFIANAVAQPAIPRPPTSDALQLQNKPATPPAASPAASPAATETKPQ